MSEDRKTLAAYSNGAKGGSNQIDRAKQMMSIFGVGDCTSGFFSEALPLLTMWQSEHGCAPSNVCKIARHNGALFVYSMSIVVQATDCSVIQCNPIAQQRARIVRARATQWNTLARLATGRSYVKPPSLRVNPTSLDKASVSAATNGRQTRVRCRRRRCSSYQTLV